jgi:hypothetical protein
MRAAGSFLSSFFLHHHHLLLLLYCSTTPTRLVLLLLRNEGPRGNGPPQHDPPRRPIGRQKLPILPPSRLFVRRPFRIGPERMQQLSKRHSTMTTLQYCVVVAVGGIIIFFIKGGPVAVKKRSMGTAAASASSSALSRFVMDESNGVDRAESLSLPVVVVSTTTVVNGAFRAPLCCRRAW